MNEGFRQIDGECCPIWWDWEVSKSESDNSAVVEPEAGS